MSSLFVGLWIDVMLILLFPGLGLMYLNVFLPTCRWSAMYLFPSANSYNLRNALCDNFLLQLLLSLSELKVYPPNRRPSVFSKSPTSAQLSLKNVEHRYVRTSLSEVMADIHSGKSLDNPRMKHCQVLGHEQAHRHRPVTRDTASPHDQRAAPSRQTLGIYRLHDDHIYLGVSVFMTFVTCLFRNRPRGEKYRKLDKRSCDDAPLCTIAALIPDRAFSKRIKVALPRSS